MKKIFFIILMLSPLTVMAIDYKLSAPIPGGQDQVSEFAPYAKYLFPFLLSFAAVAALVMFTLGAIQYMSAGGNQTRLENGKNFMTQAILGLLLAVGSVLILRTINPKLVSLDLELKPVGGSATTDGGSPDSSSSD